MIAECAYCGKTYSRRQKPLGDRSFCSRACYAASMRKRYTVYNNTKGQLVIERGTAEECAEAMDRDLYSFKATLHKVRKGQNKRWTIVEEKEEE